MIKNVSAPYGEVGKLESSWFPLVLGADGRAVDPEADEGCDIDLPDIESPKVQSVITDNQRLYVNSVTPCASLHDG